jgi:hypothetical protein
MSDDILKNHLLKAQLNQVKSAIQVALDEATKQSKFKIVQELYSMKSKIDNIIRGLKC